MSNLRSEFHFLEKMHSLLAEAANQGDSQELKSLVKEIKAVSPPERDLYYNFVNEHYSNVINLKDVSAEQKSLALLGFMCFRFNFGLGFKLNIFEDLILLAQCVYNNRQDIEAPLLNDICVVFANSNQDLDAHFVDKSLVGLDLRSQLDHLSQKSQNLEFFNNILKLAKLEK